MATAQRLALEVHHLPPHRYLQPLHPLSVQLAPLQTLQGLPVPLQPLQGQLVAYRPLPVLKGGLHRLHRQVVEQRHHHHH